MNKTNRKIKNKILFSSCLLGVAAVGIATNQEYTVHADTAGQSPSQQSTQSDTSSTASGNPYPAQQSAAQSSKAQADSAVSSLTTQKSNVDSSASDLSAANQSASATLASQNSASQSYSAQANSASSLADSAVSDAKSAQSSLDALSSDINSKSTTISANKSLADAASNNAVSANSAASGIDSSQITSDQAKLASAKSDYTSASNQAALLNQQSTDLSNQIESNNGQIKSYNSNASSLTAQSSQASSLALSFTAQASSATSQVNSNVAQASSATNTSDSLSAANDSFANSITINSSVARIASIQADSFSLAALHGGDKEGNAPSSSEASSYNVQASSATAQHDSLIALNSSYSNQVTANNTQIGSLSVVASQLTSAASQASLQAISFANQASSASSTAASLQVNIIAAQSQASSLQTDNTAKLSSLTAISTSAQSATDAASSANTTVKTLSAAISSNTDSNAALKSQYQSAANSYIAVQNSYIATNVSLSSNIADENAQINSLSAKISSLNAVSTSATSASQSYASQSSSVAAEAKITQGSIDQDNIQINSLQSESQSLAGQIKGEQDKADQAQNDYDTATSNANQYNSNAKVADFTTKEVTVTTGQSFDPQSALVSAVDKNGHEIDYSSIKVSSNINTSKGIVPQDYTVTYNYGDSSTTVTVHVENDSTMVLRRNDTDHPYITYVGDPFDETSLITSLKDDAGNDVDPSQAAKDGRLVFSATTDGYPSNDGSGYYLTYSYYPDGPQYNPVYQGRVKVKLINNSSLTTQAVNMTYGDIYNPASSTAKLIDAHGDEQSYSDALASGNLTVTGSDQIQGKQPGTYQVTFTYYNKQYTTNVNILDKSDLGLANSATIKAGTSFDPSTGVSGITDVKGNPITYTNAVKNGTLQVEGLDKVDTNVPGTYTVNYQYGGKDHDYKINVTSQKSLSYVQNPIAIYSGGKIDESKLFSSITNDTGQSISYQDAVNNGLAFDTSDVNTNAAGTYVAKVTYGNVQYPLEIQVQQTPEGYHPDGTPIINSSAAGTTSTSGVSNNQNSSNSTSTSGNSANPNTSSAANANVSGSTTTGTSTTANVNNGTTISTETTTPQKTITAQYLGKAIKLWINGKTPSFKAPSNVDESKDGNFNKKKTYSKITAQLVRSDDGYYYKLSNGKYVSAASVNAKNVVQSDKHQVQVTSEQGAKLYAHTFKNSKAVRSVGLGTVVYVQKTIQRHGELYYHVKSGKKNFYMKVDPQKVSANIGVIKGMDVYIYGQAKVYTDPTFTKVKVNVKKNTRMSTTLDHASKDNKVWKVTSKYTENGKKKSITGYIKASELLKKYKIYNNVFGNSFK